MAHDQHGLWLYGLEMVQNEALVASEACAGDGILY